jgi:phosphate transport system substrate-binding protein
VSAQLLRTLAEEYLKWKRVKDPQALKNGEVVNEPMSLKNGDVISVQGYLPDGSTLQEIRIEACDDDTAIRDLDGGACEIAVTLQRMDSTNASEHLLGLDALVVIVNHNNPVQKLSKEQIIRIFSGLTTDWTDLLSPFGKINIYTFKENAEEYHTFKSLVMGGRKIVNGQSCDSEAGGSGCDSGKRVSLKVAEDPAGIGFVELSQTMSGTRPVALFDGDSDNPSLPDAVTIGKEQYPLVQHIYMYAFSKQKKPEVNDFIQWARDRGQEFVESSGFIKASLPDNAPAPADENDERQRATKGAKHPDDSNILFQSGKTLFTDEAQARFKIKQVVDMINAKGYTGPRNVLLFGYTDNEGMPGPNLILSKRRAKLVEKEFIDRHIQPIFVEGYGNKYPLDKNNTEEAWEKNRRVEIWLKP